MSDSLKDEIAKSLKNQVKEAAEARVRAQDERMQERQARLKLMDSVEQKMQDVILSVCRAYRDALSEIGVRASADFSPREISNDPDSKPSLIFRVSEASERDFLNDEPTEVEFYVHYDGSIGVKYDSGNNRRLTSVSLETVTPSWVREILDPIGAGAAKRVK